MDNQQEEAEQADKQEHVDIANNGSSIEQNNERLRAINAQYGSSGKKSTDNEQQNSAQATADTPTFSGSVGGVTGNTVDLQQGNRTNTEIHNFFFADRPDDKAILRILRLSTKHTGYPDEMLSGDFTNDDPMLRTFKDLSQASNTDTFLANEQTDQEGKGVKLPEKPEKINDWYCKKLSDWEKCFVQAAAVLHGAPVYQVRDAANMLYQPESAISNISGNPVIAPTPRSIERVNLAKVYLKIINVGGADRLFWYDDLNASGQSSFAVRILPTIITQSNLSSSISSEQGFLQQLEAWTELLPSDSAWRATRAMGAIWYKHDQKLFSSLAHQWATNTDSRYWRRAALLLEGAFAVEYADAEQHATVSLHDTSVVLTMLAQWTREAHASFQANIGSTIAQAYGRIGQLSLEPALQGLAALLRYPIRKKDDNKSGMPLFVFAAVTWSYVSLARFGSAQGVLEHLATLVTHYCYQRHTPELTKDRMLYLAQRQLILEAVFFSFFLLSSDSLNAVDRHTPGHYQHVFHLPEHPQIPGDQKQDILLAGILAQEEPAWRENITTILCAAMLENKAEEAGYLMRL